LARVFDALKNPPKKPQRKEEEKPRKKPQKNVFLSFIVELFLMPQRKKKKE